MNDLLYPGAQMLYRRPGDVLAANTKDLRRIKNLLRRKIKNCPPMEFMQALENACWQAGMTVNVRRVSVLMGHNLERFANPRDVVSKLTWGQFLRIMSEAQQVDNLLTTGEGGDAI